MVYVYKSKEGTSSLVRKIIIRISLAILLSIGIGYLVKKVFFFSHKVQTNSMLPSIKKGEIVYFTRIFRKLEYGAIVMAHTHNPKKVILARVVGKEGDKISVRNKKIYKNGEILNLIINLTDKRASLPKEFSKRDNLNQITVGKNEYFLLCENQDECLDSRDLGLIRKENIIGKKIF